MPEKETIERARRDEQQGKSPATQAGEFVREEMDHIRQGKHGARSTKQAIAIGLSKARRAGVALPAPKQGSERMKAQAKRDSERGRRSSGQAASPRRSRAIRKALQREGREAASSSPVARQARVSAKMRGHASRSRAARRTAWSINRRLNPKEHSRP